MKKEINELTDEQLKEAYEFHLSVKNKVDVLKGYSEEEYHLNIERWVDNLEPNEVSYLSKLVAEYERKKDAEQLCGNCGYRKCRCYDIPDIEH